MPTSAVTRRFRAISADGFYKSLTGTAEGQTLILGTFANTESLYVANGTTFVRGASSNTTAQVTFFSSTRIVVSNVNSTAGFTTGEFLRVRNSNAITGPLVGNSTGGIVSTNTPSNPFSRYYMFIGKISAWANANYPPDVNSSTQSEQFDYYRDMIAMKRIKSSDITFAAIRNTWTTGTVYTQYTDTNTTLASSAFYVITTAKNVYKCIDNDYGATSTVEPTGTSSSIITTADGYRWKYMYSLSNADHTKFITTGYLAVKTLTNNDNSAQWTIQQASANGAIHHIIVANSGSGYFLLTNTFTTVSSNGTSFTISGAGGVSSGDSTYANSSIFISAGTGAGQVRKILTYTGSTKTLTVNNAFSPVPTTESTFVIGPTIIVEGDSGATVSRRATAYVSRPMNQTAGISRITLISEGLHYSTANVSFDSYVGSGARATPIISPPGSHGSAGAGSTGGHGSDPVAELYGENIIMNVQLIGIEGNTFPGNNEFRTIGILKDPLLRSGTSNYANSSVIDLTHRLVVTSVSGDFTADESVTGGTSKVRGKLVYFANTNGARTAGTLKLIRISTSGTGGYFSVGETVTGSVSGKTAIISSATRPAIKEFTGDVIYMQHLAPVTRVSDQTENVRAVLKF